MAKRSKEASKMAAFLGSHTGAPVDESQGAVDANAILQALDRHKMSEDHNQWPQVWQKLGKFLSGLETSGLMPIGETADIGTALRMFRKLWVSELTTLIFRKGNVLVMDGTFVLTKQSGKFAADVAAGDTQIDFGQALTVGDYLLLRAENKMEYMQVGSLVDGTTYNVTRNLDGSGANDWPRESVYFVRGHEGDGWLELTAVDEQRISNFTQGANWDQWLEDIRLGEIDGWQASPFVGNGFAMGDYAAGRYMIYTKNDDFVINGSRILAGQRNVILDEKGLSITTLRDGIKFYIGTELIGSISSGFEPNGGADSYFLEIFTGKEPVPFPVPSPSFTSGGMDGWGGNGFQLNFDDNPYSPPSSGRFGFPGQTVYQFMYTNSKFAVPPGKTLQFSFWRRFNNGNNYGILLNTYFSFEISYYDENEHFIRQDALYETNLARESTNPSNPTWEKVTGVGPASPDNAAYADLVFTLSNTQDIFWAEVDDVEMWGYSQLTRLKIFNNGVVVDGNINATNISQTPIADGILQAGADKKISSGWLPDLSGLYLPIGGKAADSDYLDGKDSSYFAAANHNHAGDYLPINGKAADAEKLDGKDSSYFAAAAHGHSDYALVGHNHPFDCCKVRRNGGQTIANSTWTAISWTGEDFDTNNMWSSGSEITIKTSGYYHIEIYVELGKNTVGQRCAYLKINSNIITRVNLMPMNTTTVPTTAMISWEGTLALNDKVSAFVWQNSGGNLSVSATYNSTMTVRQVVGN